MVISSPQNGIFHLFGKHFFINFCQNSSRMKIDTVVCILLYTADI